MSYFNIRLHETEQQAQRLLEYAQNMGQYITILKEIINDLQEGGEDFLDTRTILYNRGGKHRERSADSFRRRIGLDCKTL